MLCIDTKPALREQRAGICKSEFRAEMFNILNHPVFAIPNNTINNSSGGQVSSTLNAARIIQFALKLSF